MGSEVHVQGRVAVGRMADFVEAVRRYTAYEAEHDYVQPKVLQGLSGPMNTVCLVYRYEELAGYERHEARAAEDREYARVASEMPFVDGTLSYSIYRDI
jgi:hypothetical protein